MLAGLDQVAADLPEAPAGGQESAAPSRSPGSRWPTPARPGCCRARSRIGPGSPAESARRPCGPRLHQGQDPVGVPRSPAPPPRRAGLELLGRELADGARASGSAARRPARSPGGARLLSTSEAIDVERVGGLAARRRRRARPRRASTPPAKTEKRAKTRWSASSSRSWLQAIAPRRVCCRSGRSRDAAGEEPQPIAEPLQDRLRAEHPDPGRGQLDRQGQAVEAHADLGHRRRVGVVHREVGPHGHGALDEQGDRLEGAQLLQVGQVPRIGHAERRDRELALAVDPQRAAAGHEDGRDARNADQQLGDQRRGVVRPARSCRARAGCAWSPMWSASRSSACAPGSTRPSGLRDGRQHEVRVA